MYVASDANDVQPGASGAQAPQRSPSAERAAVEARTDAHQFESRALYETRRQRTVQQVDVEGKPWNLRDAQLPRP